MSTYEYLTAARDLIASPDRWRTGILAAGADGNPVSPLGDAAGYCLVGALQHVTGRIDWQNADGLPGSGQSGLAWLLLTTAGELYPQYRGAGDPLGGINNGPGHDAVLNLLDTCIGVTELAADLADALA